jgi:hypothetical protein
MNRDWKSARQVGQREGVRNLEHALVLHSQGFYCCSAGGARGLEKAAEVCRYGIVPWILVNLEESGLERDDL